MSELTFLNTEEMRRKHNHYSTNEKPVIGMEKNGKLVGWIEFFDSGDNETTIDMISVKPKHQGNGYSNILLEKVLEVHPETLAFTGESTSEALEFWKAKGVVFHPEAFVEYEKQEWDEDDIDFEQLHPFALKINKDSSYIPYWEAS